MSEHPPEEEVVLGAPGADGVPLLDQLVCARRGVLLDLSSPAPSTASKIH